MVKAAVLLISLLLILSVGIGCGGSEVTPTPTPPPTSSPTPAPTPTPTPVAVMIDVHSQADAGGDIVARINVTGVTALDSYRFDVSYSPEVIDLNVAEGEPRGVTSGVIGVTTTPVDRWKFIAPAEGTRAIRVTGSIPKIGGANGSGYLAEIHFRVIGSTGDQTEISLSNVSLSDASGKEIGPLQLAGGTVNVVGIGPTPTSTAAGQLPCRFYGKVALDGADVPDGTQVSAIIEGNTYNTTTPSEYGASTYVLMVTAPAGVFYSEGTTITFVIDGYVADQPGAWVTGGNLPLDLDTST